MSGRDFVTRFRGENTPQDKLVKKIKQERLTPNSLAYNNLLDNEQGFDYIKMEPTSPGLEENLLIGRNSLSMSDITALREDMQLNLDIGSRSQRKSVFERYNIRNMPMTPPSLVQSRNKYVSLAEAIYHFERDTPNRFHSSKEPQIRSKSAIHQHEHTIPQSPMLRCKTRARPVRGVLTQQEKEEQELEVIKAYKIKANPVPKGVIEGFSNLPVVQRKPKTVPEPFKLTEVHKKPVVVEEVVPNFKARPVPKTILEKPHLLKKSPITLTNPQTPKFHSVRSKSGEIVHKSSPQFLKPNTKRGDSSLSLRNSEEKPPRQAKPVYNGPEPFSFEKRDEMLKKKKEERIKSFIDEEKKLASQFKANPVPKIIKKKIHEAAGKSLSSNSSENKENIKFEARPANVLHKKPFVPVLKAIQLTEHVPFSLTSEKRALERALFDQKLKQREEELERLRHKREQKNKELEEAQIARIRSETIHKAQPIPSFEPNLPERREIPLTVPQTPLFIRRMNQN